MKKGININWKSKYLLALNSYLTILGHLEKNDKKAFEDFTSRLKSDSKKRGEVLLEIGEVNEYMHFLNSGVLRHIRKDAQGRVFNNWFSFEGNVAMSLESFVHQKKSNEGLEVLENAEYLYIHYSDMMELAAKYHSIETIYRKVLEEYYMELEQRLYRLQTFSAKQKYQYLAEQKPYFIQKIPQHHIASYLGITKETLSRIRKY